MKASTQLLAASADLLVQNRILLVRGQKVMIDQLTVREPIPAQLGGAEDHLRAEELERNVRAGEMSCPGALRGQAVVGAAHTRPTQIHPDEWGGLADERPDQR